MNDIHIVVKHCFSWFNKCMMSIKMVHDTRVNGVHITVGETSCFRALGNDFSSNEGS